MTKRKIINDPVYGFITVDNPLIFSIIAHPYYQRLRRINQMALAQLVYPGAVHTRLHHSLGAYHLIGLALTELKSKGVAITPEEDVAIKAAILLHDVGHGPFSHALENVLIPGVNHEQLGLQVMHSINRDLDNQLEMAIKIFTGKYHKPFLHQLISGQLDVDRMDYLTRDSFFTGVSEGVIGYHRILKMLVVHEGELVIEEKGIYSVEKFLVARRQMYWQVYLHKAVLSAEKMLIKIMERVREIYSPGDSALQTQSPLDYFLSSSNSSIDGNALQQFCALDDADVMFALKRWSLHHDTVLATLARGLLVRDLLKCHLQTELIDEQKLFEIRKVISERLNISIHEAAYLAFTGEAENTTYKPGNEHINILFKNSVVKEISQIDNPLIHQTLSTPVKKFYICQLT